jgi:hypothetical protein
MTVKTRSDKGNSWTLTTDGFGSLINLETLLWTPETYDSSTWTEETYPSQQTYITLSDSTGTAWYFYNDGFGSFELKKTAPSNYPIESDTGTSGSIIYLIITQDSDTWYVYPDGFGSFTAVTTEP